MMASPNVRAGNPLVRLAKRLGVAVLIGLLIGFMHRAEAAAPNPLSPPDTSSPRGTLQGFIETVDNIYAGMTDLLDEYAKSDRLYLTPDERQQQIALLRRAPTAVRFLDTSGISPVLQETTSIERVLQLKEVLDRIELPAVADMPDQEAMVRLASKRWRLPGTEIDFVQIQDGPRAGEYLVSAETMDRLPEFYQKVENLPYRLGPAQQLNEVFRRVSSERTDTIYDAFLSSPIGLAGLVPPRWLLSLPGWAKIPFAGVTAWQWLGLIIGLIIGGLFVFGSYRLTRHLADRGENDPVAHWQALPVPVAILLVTTFLVPLLCTIFHIGGITRVVIAVAQTVAFSLSAAWLSMIGLIILGDVVVSSEHLRRSRLDNQLIKLIVRLVGVMCAIVFLIRGANELGFPAYSGTRRAGRWRSGGCARRARQPREPSGFLAHHVRKTFPHRSRYQGCGE